MYKIVVDCHLLLTPSSWASAKDAFGFLKDAFMAAEDTTHLYLYEEDKVIEKYSFGS